MKNNDQTRGERVVGIVMGTVAIVSGLGFPILCAAMIVAWWA